MMTEEKATLIDLGGGIVQETDAGQGIEMIAAEVVIEIIEAGEKIPESVIASGQTALLTRKGRAGEVTAEKGPQPRRRRISPVRLVNILHTVLSEQILS